MIFNLVLHNVPVPLNSPFLFYAMGFILVLLAILFLQSGIDKITDYKGNLEWLTGHFASSPFKNMVPLLLASLTFLEVTAGITSGIGAVAVVLTENLIWGALGLMLSGVSILALFLGQRMAKDYPGAASLIPYFLVVLVGLVLLILGGK